MKIKLIEVGKTNDIYLKNAINDYSERLSHYTDFSIKTIPELKNAKNLTVNIQKVKDSEAILSAISDSDDVILLDEKGKEFTSVEFADFIQKKQLYSNRPVTFVIGGPFGFSEQMYKRADSKISLSKMTFSHQMIRLLFVEQLYRAFTIIHGEHYHHE